MKSLLYTAELDLAEPDMKPFLDWYANRHAPDLFPIGFKSCACYRTDDDRMNLFDIYEIEGHGIFAGAGYARLKVRDKYAAPIESTRRNKAHTIYEQFEGFPGSPSQDPSLDADWVVAARFDTPEPPDIVTAKLRSPIEKMLSGGVVRARLGIRTTDHPVYTTTRPQFMVFLEADARPEASVAEELVGRLGTFCSNVICFSGHRLYPWPTTP